MTNLKSHTAVPPSPWTSTRLWFSGRIARTALPLMILVLSAALATAPLTSGRDISFVLSKDRVAVAPERMRVTKAIYRGNDTKGEPFSISAGSAVQQTSSDPVVKLSDLAAHIMLQQGPADIVAKTGRYDMTNDRVFVDGPVTVTGPHGDTLVTRDVAIDLGDRTVQSTTPVQGRTTLGTFSANRLHADLDARTLNLDGAVRLHIPRRAAK